MEYKLPPLPEPTCFGDDYYGIDIEGYTAEQMQAYAIAAIEAQGVPDGWQLVPKEPTEQMLREGWDFAGTRGNAEAAYKAMLASAPPAPEVENRNPQASVVQQEPMLYVSEYELAQFNRVSDWMTATIRKHPGDGRVALYTHPAQQAKPQPLSYEQIREAVNGARMMFTAPDIKVARAIEAAHGIQGS